MAKAPPAEQLTTLAGAFVNSVLMICCTEACMMHGLKAGDGLRSCTHTGGGGDGAEGGGHGSGGELDCGDGVNVALMQVLYTFCESRE